MDLFVQYQANGEVHDATDANSKPIAWRCVKCGDYAILGQATDTGPHAAQIAVEVRAAELAAGWTTQHGTAPDSSMDEDIGWLAHASFLDERSTENDEQHAGYLARAIVQHGDE